MRPVRSFEEFVREGIAKKQRPDKSRAEFLRKESENKFSFLSEILKMIAITDTNANSIVTQCYDIIMELIRARMLLGGYNASGQGAHEAEVSYLRVLGFSEKDVQFADQMRFFRNGMLYYGKILDKEYAEKVVDFVKQVYLKLIK